MFQRVAAPEFGTAALAELRLGLGALVLLPFLARQWRSFPARIWPRVVLVGAINSALPMLPVAIASGPEAPVAAPAGGSAVVLGVVCTGLSYAMYYRLVQRIGPARAVTVTYLVPLFAVGWAWWLLDEPLTLAMGIACALILGSVAIAQRR